MKKSLVALAALAIAGVASAQSSVTLFGVVDAAVSGTSNKSEYVPTLAAPVSPLFVDSIKTGRTELRNSGYNSSRLGFRGTEDLGGGLAASFWLEAPITNDDGATGVSTFARRSTVSLSGGFGEVRLGRDYTPTFWNDTVFDPFGTNGVGTNLISTANSSFIGSSYVRASNTVGYFLPPNLGGFYGQVMYGFHEKTKYDPGIVTPDVANNSRTGRYIGGRFGYANGPLDVAASYGNSTIGDEFFAGTTTAAKIFNVGASYDFGVVKLFGEVSRVKNEIDVDTPFVTGTFGDDVDLNGYLIGVTVPVGAGLIRASYSHVKFDENAPFPLVDDAKANKLALGYVHNLSKRTALYATVARIRNKNGAALTVGGPVFVESFGGSGYQAKTSTGYDIGIRHAF